MINFKCVNKKREHDVDIKTIMVNGDSFALRSQEITVKMFSTAYNLPDFNVIGLHETGTGESITMATEEDGSDVSDLSESDTTEEYSSSTSMMESEASDTELNSDKMSVIACSPHRSNLPELLPVSVYRNTHHAATEPNNNPNSLQVSYNIPNLPDFGLYEGAISEIDVGSSTDWKPCSPTNLPNFTEMNQDSTPSYTNPDRLNEITAKENSVTNSEQFMPKLEAITERFESFFTLDVEKVDKKGSKSNSKRNRQTRKSTKK